MKKLFYPLVFALSAFLFIYSCSTEEDATLTPGPTAVYVGDGNCYQYRALPGPEGAKVTYTLRRCSDGVLFDTVVESPAVYSIICGRETSANQITFTYGGSISLSDFGNSNGDYICGSYTEPTPSSITNSRIRISD